MATWQHQLWSSSSKFNRRGISNSSRRQRRLFYKEGFHNGTIIVGEFKGESIQDAKPKVREAMIKADWHSHLQPEGLVISHSAGEYVVALMDQWYLDYGELSWRAQTEGYVRLSFLFLKNSTKKTWPPTVCWRKWIHTHQRLDTLFRRL